MKLKRLLTDYRHTAIALAGFLAQGIEILSLHGTALHVVQLVSLALTVTATATVSNVDHPQETGNG